jgi:hypothetical protein
MIPKSGYRFSEKIMRQQKLPRTPGGGTFSGALRRKIRRLLG